MTNRPTNRDHEPSPTSRQTPDFSSFYRNDSYWYSTSTEKKGGSVPRLNKKQLQTFLSTLGERDFSVLNSIRTCRYLLTSQIERLHFTDASSQTAALRATNRNLKKLGDHGLIQPLTRRIGGIRAGSSAMVWHLTEGGEHLLRLANHNAKPHRRFFEPSPHFLAHTLATAECYIQLKEANGMNGLSLIEAEVEPECWRSYSHRGKIVMLKPDLYAVTSLDEYMDSWFFEIDLSTESTMKIVEKCQHYYDYYCTGLEQKEHEVFPLVVWIVPDGARKELLAKNIRNAFQKQPKLFAVIRADELDSLLRQGVESNTLC